MPFYLDRGEVFAKSDLDVMAYSRLPIRSSQKILF